jgi:hypothetical protein
MNDLRDITAVSTAEAYCNMAGYRQRPSTTKVMDNNDHP